MKNNRTNRPAEAPRPANHSIPAGAWRSAITGKAGKTLRMGITCLLMVVLLFACLPVALAAEEIPAPGLDAALEKAKQYNAWITGKSAAEVAAELNVSEWDVLSAYGTESLPEPLITVQESDTWETLMQRLLEKYGVDESTVGIGYYNTRTGEEKYINADKYRVSASMFKIPLNMIYADRVSSGEMTMDTEIWGMSYAWLQNRTIVYSDNERACNLWDNLGGYSVFKTLQIPYLGNDPAEDIGWNYQVDNFYTPREFIHMMRMLYDEPERFPGVLENMLEATPHSYFRQYDHRYPVAQKYGFVEQNEDTGHHTYLTTCGIAFTGDPCCLVVFTDNVTWAYDLISEYCTVMCDYTEMMSARQDVLDAQAAEEAARREASDAAAFENAVAALSARFDAPAPVLTKTVARTGAEENNARFEMKFSVVSCILVGWILVAMLTGFVLIFRHNRSGRINAFWAVIAIILAGTGLSLCVLGLDIGTVFARPEGDPRETVTTFFDSLLSRDYPAAYACLGNYAGLGVENAPAEEDARLMYDALLDSYSYSLRGDCVTDKMQAHQTVTFRYLNLNAVKKAAAGEVNPILEKIVSTRTRSEVYDEDGNYLPAVTDEVYLTAIRKVLEDPTQFYTSADISVTLEYRNDSWMIQADDGMMTPLSGGVC